MPRACSRAPLPARPIRVTCSISGKTWQESEIAQAEVPHGHEFSPADVLNTCRERWALVKALLGVNPEWSKQGKWFSEHGRMAIFTQRDAVYAALADMARAEDVLGTKAVLIEESLPEALAADAVLWLDRPYARPSTWLLERFVSQLIQTVGAQKEHARFPCSPTCTHDDAATPGHPGRVKERSEAVAAETDHRRVDRNGRCRHNERWNHCGLCDEHENGREAGAEAMRAACWEAVRGVMQKYGISDASPMRDEMKSAIEGAAP